MNYKFLDVKKIVIDTSVITNPYSTRNFAGSPQKAIEKLLSLIENQEDYRILATPSTIEELKTFVGELPINFYRYITIKSPNKYTVKIPGIILYDFLAAMRDRINRGLRIAEKAVREFRDKDEREAIRYLRENYRRVMREGIVDSKEDIDTILLALQEEAALSTADEGQMDLAMKLGIEIIEPAIFYELLKGGK